MGKVSDFYGRRRMVRKNIGNMTPRCCRNEMKTMCLIIPVIRLLYLRGRRSSMFIYLDN